MFFKGGTCSSNHPAETHTTLDGPVTNHEAEGLNKLKLKANLDDVKEHQNWKQNGNTHAVQKKSDTVTPMQMFHSEHVYLSGIARCFSLH